MISLAGLGWAGPRLALHFCSFNRIERNRREDFFYKKKDRGITIEHLRWGLEDLRGRRVREHLLLCGRVRRVPNERWGWGILVWEVEFGKGRGPEEQKEEMITRWFKICSCWEFEDFLKVPNYCYLATCSSINWLKSHSLTNIKSAG